MRLPVWINSSLSRVWQFSSRFRPVGFTLISRTLSKRSGDLKARIAEFVKYYITECYHESLNNLTSEDVLGANYYSSRFRQLIQATAVRFPTIITSSEPATGL